MGAVSEVSISEHIPTYLILNVTTSSDCFLTKHKVLDVFRHLNISESKQN
jgi:hypothetical protein